MKQELVQFLDDTEEDDYSQVAININYPIKFACIAIRSLLRKNKKGVFLITASLAEYQGTFSAPLYCATNHAVVGFVRSIKDLDELGGVKVVAVAPGCVSPSDIHLNPSPPPLSTSFTPSSPANARNSLVRTPLWTDYPEKMKQFGYTIENSITPDQVARDMVSLVTEGKYGGGTCLENSVNGTRVLGAWNIEAPDGTGTTVLKEVLDRNYPPMIEIMRRMECTN
jgi:NAD(P)-dependent dehydrogenase (short-subunit alcohol dehydrogenase family)